MVIIVMGVTGAGKTTIGELLAKELGWTFADADQYHSAANKEKIHNGIALTDADRQPWLQALHDAIAGWLAAGQNAILACSALKESYRDTLSVSPEVKIAYLKGSYDLIAGRLRNRHGHFATESILKSQFATLQEPTELISVNIAGTPEQIVEEIRSRLKMT